MVTAENGIKNQHLTGGIARPTFCNQRKYSITTPHGISTWFVDLEVSTVVFRLVLRKIASLARTTESPQSCHGSFM